jgi:hypothetical protein
MGHGDVGTPCFWSGGILWAAPIQMNFWHSGGHPSEAFGFYLRLLVPGSEHIIFDLSGRAYLGHCPVCFHLHS